MEEDLEIQTLPEAPAVEWADEGFLPWLLEHAQGKRRLTEGHEPFVLTGNDRAWVVVRGHLDVFTVGLDEDGQPIGSREHFLSVDAGDLLLGIDFARYKMGHGFLAAGSTGTEVCEFDRTLVKGWLAAWANMVDGWIGKVGEASVRSIPFRPQADRLAASSESVTLEQGQTVSARKGVLWIEAASSELSFLSTEDVFFEAAESVFPLPPHAWVEAFEARDYRTCQTEVIIQRGQLEEGLTNFHIAVCNNEFISKRLIKVDEYNRLKTKAEYQEAARREAMAEIASVLTPELSGLADARSAGDIDPLLAACRLIGRHLGIEIRPHPEANTEQDTGRQLDAIAKASRFRLRDIALRGTWWEHDHGPFLAFWGEEWEPVAIMPVTPTRYEAILGATGQRVKVTEEFAKELQPAAKVFYRPFPDGFLNAWKLFLFGTKGLEREFFSVALMGVGLGLMGLVTPFLSQLIFDVVIPGAARGQLFQLCVGMIAASLGALAFDLTRSVAVLRIEGKMDYSVQAALWDRLMNLPLGFFRKYTAGDLANRAEGIDTIRTLISGAGVTAVLGAMTSLFYLVLLFTYSAPLAWTGILLVAIAMIFTAGMNLWQLSHQRKLYDIMGKISSTVLQFISGVAKIRVAGAEDHAFKVWARQFAQQRTISFTVGRIENAVQVFASGFPVVASMTLFGVLAFVQSQPTPGSLAPSVTTGEFIAFNTAFGVFLGAMLQLSQASLEILQVVPVYERFKPILQTEPEVTEAKSYPGELNGEIEIYHVNFRYTEDGPMILKNVSIHIKPGEFVAFVGPSGSGKSTLLRLLLGFESPESGKIYYDGQDLSSLDLREVRQQIGVVLQTSRLMPTDIFRNIIGNHQLTLDDAWDAAERSGLAEDIKKMPMQMHTVVSEGGGAFSGGQKQRLMIARAIIHRPRMIFLDEATSALDNRAQAVVTDSMDRLQATRIVVAHRLSTIQNADRIFVLVDGRVEEQGTYEELMKLNGQFAELARRQIA